MPPDVPSTHFKRQSGHAREPKCGRARCKVCGYSGWTWMFKGIRYCRACAWEHGFSDPLKDCENGINPCRACSRCRANGVQVKTGG